MKNCNFVAATTTLCLFLSKSIYHWIIFVACAWWTICKPFKKHIFSSVYFKKIYLHQKHDYQKGGAGIYCTHEQACCTLLYFLFLLHFNHRPPKNIGKREREKKIRHVMCKKLEKIQKSIWDLMQTFQFPILESTSGSSDSKSLLFNCYIMLLILVAITWFERIEALHLLTNS